MTANNDVTSALTNGVGTIRPGERGAPDIAQY
ncbi:hypothetical protein AAur_1875 [Paenarthrobacter aurescens TC1]|uniref:Uncharacterized protein n=1 Tax=Paenarthrobacter aurescens (strain TC1) TaxID=290340 RepID=A1R5W2_PAEAT|nr:hypothetical protein AAur_1875 [Paenarthrobacter aurescens TC1]